MVEPVGSHTLVDHHGLMAEFTISSLMKSKLARSIVIVLCCTLVACVNPYLAQMDNLDADYRAGLISRSEYDRQMRSLHVRSDAWSAQNSANVAMGATALSAAAVIGGALIEAEAHEDVAHAINQRNKTASKGKSHGGSGKKSGGGGSKKPETKGKPDEPQGGGGSKPPPGGGSKPPR